MDSNLIWKPVLGFNFCPTAHDFNLPLKESNENHVFQNRPLTSLPVADPLFISFSPGKFQTWDEKSRKTLKPRNYCLKR